MISKIRNIISDENILLNETLKDHTSYRIGGPAEIYIYPENKDQLIELIQILEKENLSYFIIGKGSNVLAADNGFKGCIIDLTKHFSEIIVNGEQMIVGAGALITAIAFTAIKNSLSGMEELAGIPGTLGGAILMNAGCYGNEISKHIESVEVINSDYKYENIPKDRLEFGYRTTNLKKNIILGAKLKFKTGDRDRIKNRTDEFLDKRRTSQPLDLPSCGSVFKRPENSFAGKLIEEAGLKGKRIGGAEVSEKHAGFIVNRENASSKDVENLIEFVKDTVNKKFNVMLEEEVIYIR